MNTMIFGLGVGVITAMAGISIIESPIKAIVVISALVILHGVTS